ncbi:hypothetical protein MJO29_008007 [Puccinia striiformis f. sp. tritici]|nr:hypothetical protein MJO29_008007 [Puccinia striiformis f. sp. tritici]
MGVGVALSRLKQSSTLLFDLAQLGMLVTLEISSKDRSYLWFLNWMSKQSQKNSSTNQLTAETSYHQLSDGTHEVNFALIRGPGNHYLKFCRAGFKSLLVDLLKETKSCSMKTEEGKIVIYTSFGGTEWRPFGQPRTKRPLNSVVLDQGIKENLVADIKEGLSDDKSNHLLTNVPEQSVILLEDVDAAFVGRDLVSVFYGLTSTTSQKEIFMTINHLEKLDWALIRQTRNQPTKLKSRSTTMSSEEANCNQNTEVVEEVEVKQTFILQTAGFDARFPNTNQTKHCWQAYVDHHKCKNRHGVEHDACRHFYRTFNSLCPNRWIARWDEQREAGKFPVQLGR